MSMTEQTCYQTGRASGKPYAPGNKLAVGDKAASQGQFCQLCQAWRGSLGLEPTPELYVEHLVGVFREVRRVLKPDGCVFLNLGDSYSSGVGSNVSDLIAQRIKESVILNGSGCALTIAPHRNSVLKDNEFAPDHVFTRLLGIKRILIKQRNDDFCQVLDTLTPIADCRISSDIIAAIDKANGEVVVYPGDGIVIVVSEHNLNAHAPLEIPILARSAENGQAAFPIEKTSEPMPKSIGDVQATRDAISLDALSESIAQVDFVDNPIALADASMARTKLLCNLCVTKATPEHFAFTLMGGRIKFACSSITHLFISNSYGSIVHYTEVYHNANQLSNERKAKQELGIPEMVKRALMRDGWICRSTIIWHKTNCMPESVTDRPTKSHEYVFLLAKSARYFYDAEAVKEKGVGRETFGNSRKKGNCEQRQDNERNDMRITPGCNRRTVWTIPTQSYRKAHFATFPEKLVEPMILAGTSAKGECPVCGKAWRRVVEKKTEPTQKTYQGNWDKSSGYGKSGWLPGVQKTTTTGWTPQCAHDADPVPQTVLDPFAGTATVGRVAIKHRRRFVGLELNPDYIGLASERMQNIAVKLPL